LPGCAVAPRANAQDGTSSRFGEALRWTAIIIEFGRNADALLTTPRPTSDTLITHRPRIDASKPSMQLPTIFFVPAVYAAWFRAQRAAAPDPVEPAVMPAPAV